MFKFLFSTIGQKIQIAISGLLFSIFLMFHLFNNLVMYTGAANFNSMVSFLKSIHIVIRILEFGLLAIILIHVINAIVTTIKNRKANNGKYAVPANPPTASLNSKTMIWSGSIVLLFLIFHLRYYWYTFQNLSKDANFYEYMSIEKFGFLGHGPTQIFYIIAIFLIAMHLRHGFMSVFKTLGISQSIRSNILKFIAFIFWGIIPAGFIIIVLSIRWGFI